MATTNYYKNNIALNSICKYITSNTPDISNNFYKSMNIPSGTLTFSSSINETPLNLGYSYKGTDISQYFIANYIESSTTNFTNSQIPSWCTKIRTILVGAGGSGSDGTKGNEIQNAATNQNQNANNQNQPFNQQNQPFNQQNQNLFHTDKAATLQYNYRYDYQNEIFQQQATWRLRQDGGLVTNLSDNTTNIVIPNNGSFSLNGGNEYTFHGTTANQTITFAGYSFNDFVQRDFEALQQKRFKFTSYTIQIISPYTNVHTHQQFNQVNQNANNQNQPFNQQNQPYNQTNLIANEQQTPGQNGAAGGGGAFIYIPETNIQGKTVDIQVGSSSAQSTVLQLQGSSVATTLGGTTAVSTTAGTAGTVQTILSGTTNAPGSGATSGLNNYVASGVTLQKGNGGSAGTGAAGGKSYQNPTSGEPGQSGYYRIYFLTG